MRLLFVANRMPYPPYRGDKLKIYNLAKELQRHSLDLITIAENQEDIDSIEPLSKIFNRIDYVFIPRWKSFLNTFFTLFSNEPFQIGYFRSARFKAKLSEIIINGKYDGIHVQHIRMAQFIPKELKHKVVLDLPDAFSMYWKRRYHSAKNPFIKAFNFFEYKRLNHFEIQTIPTFPQTLVCSKEDQRYLSKIDGAKVDVLPNGVDTKTFASSEEAFIKNRILFTGNMDYAPNIDAVQYFVHQIFPIIQNEIPEVEFIIAGQRPVPKVFELASEQVKVTGFIENLAKEYAKAHVVVSPLRIGAGTQNKVLEALSMDIPVVTTYVGYEGLGLPDGIGALPSKDANEFAHNVVRILRDDEFRLKMASEGGKAIRDSFSWPSIAQQLEKYLTFK